MGNIPFFYYDMLARIIPGAFTLATLLVMVLIPNMVPDPWVDFIRWNYTLVAWADFLRSNQALATFLVPVVLGGVSYAIGVIYEALNFSGGLVETTESADKRAFSDALERFRLERRKVRPDEEALRGMNWDEGRSVWEELVLMGSLEPGMVRVFAHCHRFQAEYKMFLHLVYPVFLFALVAFLRGLDLQGVLALGLALFFFWVAHRRNERRWWQVLSFCEQLNLRNDKDKSRTEPLPAHYIFLC